MCTQEIHYPMYLYAYCVMYDNHCITHAILLIFYHYPQLTVIIIHYLFRDCATRSPVASQNQLGRVKAIWDLARLASGVYCACNNYP